MAVDAPPAAAVAKALIERDFAAPDTVRFIEQCPLRIQERVRCATRPSSAQ